MKHLLLVTCLGFVAGLTVSACGNSTPPPATCTAMTCEGCCDADVCRKGDTALACGARGLACDVCAGGQICSANQSCRFPTVDSGTDGGSDAGLDAGTDGGRDAGTDAGLDAGSVDAGNARCAATPVSCSDQASQGLDFKTTVNAATVSNVADGTGFKSTIDATAGSNGFSAVTESYVYAKFTPTGLQKVALSDEAAVLSTDWDIAFRRYVIRLNAGSSGPSCVDAAKLPIGTDYDSVLAPPTNGVYATDDFLGPPPTCTFKDDGSGLGTSPSTALASYYLYMGCLTMTNKVFVVRTRLGRDVKLVVTSYYATEAAQTNCNSGGSPGAAGATIRVRWSFLD